MDSKLTLNIDTAVIEQAKKYARLKGRSLSDLIENYLKALTSQNKEYDSELSPLLQSMKSTFKAPESTDYKNELTKILDEKYRKK
ncbi:MAG: DUF6364 family protein [Flavobacterium sp.]